MGRENWVRSPAQERTTHRSLGDETGSITAEIEMASVSFCFGEQPSWGGPRGNHSKQSHKASNMPAEPFPMRPEAGTRVADNNWPLWEVSDRERGLGRKTPCRDHQWPFSPPRWVPSARSGTAGEILSPLRCGRSRGREELGVPSSLWNLARAADPKPRPGRS